MVGTQAFRLLLAFSQTRTPGAGTLPGTARSTCHLLEELRRATHVWGQTVSSGPVSSTSVAWSDRPWGAPPGIICLPIPSVASLLPSSFDE